MFVRSKKLDVCLSEVLRTILREGGEITLQRIVPRYLRLLHVCNPHQCVRKDLVERTKPRKIYAAFSIFAQSTKGWRGEAKAGKDTDTSRAPDQHSRFPK